MVKGYKRVLISLWRQEGGPQVWNSDGSENTEIGKMRPEAVSLVARQPWIDYEMEATCLHAGREYLAPSAVKAPSQSTWEKIPLGHKAPCEECTCGIYSWDKLTLITNLDPRLVLRKFRVPTVVTVEVENYGKIVPYEKGHRSEKARILGIVPMDYTHAARAFVSMAVKDGVPMLSGFFDHHIDDIRDTWVRDEAEKRAQGRALGPMIR